MLSLYYDNQHTRRYCMLLASRGYSKLILTAIVLILSGLIISRASADEITITCPTTINQDIEDTVKLVGSGYCILARGFEMTNDVKVTRGVSFIVRGTVDGKISETGEGNVIVRGGVVNNDIIETGSGVVRVVGGGVVTGKIDESGPGNVLVNNGSVDNDVLESGLGAVNIIADSFVAGNVDESGKGSVAVDSSSLVEGNVFEEDAGHCINVDPDSVEGVVDCD